MSSAEPRGPSSKEKGDRAEDFAAQLLQREGYRIIARNERTPSWELDIIAYDEQTLCFIEVRSRKSLDQGGPLESVSVDKQRRLIRGARAYLATHWADGQSLPEVRFDVLGLWGDPTSPHHELIRGAFVSPT